MNAIDEVIEKLIVRYREVRAAEAAAWRDYDNDVAYGYGGQCSAFRESVDAMCELTGRAVPDWSAIDEAVKGGGRGDC